MSRPIALTFNVDVVERQRLLDGAEHVWLEGAAPADGGDWMLSLNYARPKESGFAVDEADLTLETPAGAIQAGLESGRVEVTVDDVAGDEQEQLALEFHVEAGDGEFLQVTGTARIRGEVSSAVGQVELILDLA